MSMVLQIELKDKVVKDKGEKHPTTFAELRRFLVNNSGRDCFSKSHGQVWMITKEGNWRYVARNLPEISLNKYLENSLKY